MRPRRQIKSSPTKVIVLPEGIHKPPAADGSTSNVEAFSAAPASDAPAAATRNDSAAAFSVGKADLVAEAAAKAATSSIKVWPLPVAAGKGTGSVPPHRENRFSCCPQPESVDTLAAPMLNCL